MKSQPLAETERFGRIETPATSKFIFN